MLEESNVAQPVPEEQAPQEQPAEESPETVGQVLQQPEEKQETVSLSKFMKEKRARQELESQIAELQTKANDGASKTEIATDLKALAEEHNIDAGFLSKLAKAIEAQAEARIEEKLRPITEKEKQAKIDSAFQVGFGKAMENMSEYKDIVNPDVIKTLSLNPNNANKTFRQLIEETYGNALGGRKTIETAVPRGGNASGELDYGRAKRDSAYFKEVMSDPVLKKQYNDRMIVEA